MRCFLESDALWLVVAGLIKLLPLVGEVSNSCDTAVSVPSSTEGEPEVTCKSNS